MSIRFNPLTGNLDLVGDSSGGGIVDSVVAGDRMDVDTTDPRNPVVIAEDIVNPATHTELARYVAKEIIDNVGDVVVGESEDTAVALQVGTDGQVLTADSGERLGLKWATPSGGGSGDVVGPSSATDNGIARFDTTTGKLIQDSSATISDNGAMVVTAATNTDIPLIVKGADYFGVSIQQWYNSYLGTPSLYGEFDANGNFRVRPGGNDARSVVLGDPPGAGFPGVWIGYAAASPNYGNYSFLSDGTGGVLFNATGGQLTRFRNGNYARMTVGQHGINVGGVDTGTISDEPSSAQVFKIEPGIFSATTKTVLVLQGLASQSGNLLECQDNTGAVLAKVSAGGDIEVTDTTKGVILASPNGSRWRITVDNSGTLITTSI